MSKEEVKVNISSSEPILSPRQLGIHKGLKNIGEEIAGFYLDGVRIFKDKKFITRPYLLAHIAREIECGLRDVWSIKDNSKERCSKCNGIKKQKSHIDFICEALGVERDDPFAKKWHKIAKEFNKYAHRHGAWSPPRDQDTFDTLWNEFESILFQLHGSYLNLLDRVDIILKLEIPSKEVLETLSNLLEKESRSFYFFKNLKSLKWLKPLKEKRFFKPEKNPEPYESEDTPGTFGFPYWSVLYYLGTAAKLNAEAPDDEISDTLVEIVDEIIENKNDNYITDLSLLQIISLLPIQKIKTGHIEFTGNALNSKWPVFPISSAICTELLPHLINNNAKSLLNELIRTVIDYKKEREAQSIRFIPVLDWSFYTRHIAGKIKDIARICGVEALAIGIEKINELIEIDDRQFTKSRINLLTQYYYKGEKFNSQLVSFIHAVLKELPPDRIEGHVIDMMKNQRSIFRRLALHAVNHHYDELNDIFWSLDENPLNDRDLKLELYELFKSNCKSFTQKQIETALHWIESADYNISSSPQQNKFLAYAKKEWLTALKETGNERVNQKYDEYHRINNADVDHPGHDSWSTFGAGGGIPEGFEEILKKENAAIVDYMNNFKEESSNTKSLTKHALSKKFESAVPQNPLKFAENIEPFKNLETGYLSSLYSGFKDAWKQGERIAEEKILDFTLQILNSKNFRKDCKSNGLDYRIGTVSAIVELMEAGINDDGHAFEEVHLEKIEEILLLLLNMTNSNLNEIEDVVDTTFNSAKGRIISALINYSLHFATVNNLKNNRWKETVKLEFEKRLDGTVAPSLEYFGCLGWHFHNIYYLDEEWAKENISKVFSQTDDLYWEATASTYFLFNRGNNKYIFELLKNQKVFEKALTWRFQNETVLEFLIQQICDGYVNGWENIDDQDSLIHKVLCKKEKRIFEIIVRYFQFRPNKERQKNFLRSKIRPLWKSILDVLTPEPKNREFRHVAASLWRFIYDFDELDDQLFEWLKVSAKSFDKNSHEYGFIEYLSQLAALSPQKAGELFIDMLQAGAIPMDPTEETKIVECLYQNGHKEIADEICNLYAINGFEGVLRELYNKYNPGQQIMKLKITKR